MTVGELKNLIRLLPDDMPVIADVPVMTPRKAPFIGVEDAVVGELGGSCPPPAADGDAGVPYGKSMKLSILLLRCR